MSTPNDELSRLEYLCALTLWKARDVLFRNSGLTRDPVQLEFLHALIGPGAAGVQTKEVHIGS